MHNYVWVVPDSYVKQREESFKVGQRQAFDAGLGL
jgi:hypothetical protein